MEKSSVNQINIFINKKIYEKNLPAKKKKKWALIGRSPLSIFIFILKRKHFFLNMEWIEKV